MTLADVQNDQLVRRAVRAEPVRLWGLTPTQLHDAAWESHGVQAVRRGSGQRIEPDRRYVLLDRDETVQPSGSYADASKAERRWWKRSEQEARTIPQAPGELPAQDLSDARGFRERVEIDDTGRFIRVQRTYTRQLPPQRGVRITENRKLAAAWASDRAWDGAAVKPGGRFVATSVRGDSRAGSGQLVGDVLHELSTAGAMPDGVEEVLPGVWAHRDACIEPGARFVGPVWIGTNTQIGAGDTVVGPCFIPDGASAGVCVRLRGMPEDSFPELPRFGRWGSRSKRAFDIAASMLVLTLTLPVSLAIAAAILVQAGRPILFANERQTIGGRRFRCLKFRTMRRDAEQIKRAYAKANTCDGPQFHIPNDPRTFPVGRLLRRCHLDELPQLINVIRGDMSIVGPRPSPDEENQRCPIWRRERLSVRAGITGLWQVSCRRRPGTDFQEWIRYDLEYVRGWSWRLDVKIMWRTLLVAVRRGAGLLMPAGGGETLRTPSGARFTPEGSVGVIEPKPQAEAITNAA